MKTKSKIGAHILRGSLVASFFIVVIVALSSAINLSNRFPKVPSPQSDRAFGINEHESASSVAARVEFSASRQRVRGHEIAGFSARQAHEENLTPPATLKPMEQEAWLAMARRQGASSGMEFTSFYPARYGEPFVVQGEGVRVAVRPMGGTDATAQVGNDQVIYRNAYPETDSVHVVSARRSEEFLFLQSECAPREFAYELSEVSEGTHVELVNGEPEQPGETLDRSMKRFTPAPPITARTSGLIAVSMYTTWLRARWESARIAWTS